MDGDVGTAGSGGWGIWPQVTSTNSFFVPTSAATNVSSGLQFTLSQNYGGEHQIGRFRLYYTTSAPPFSGGTTWTLLSTGSALCTSTSNTCTAHSANDGSWLTSAPTTGQGVYTVTYAGAKTGIRGFRLETLPDPSVLAGKVGWSGTGGNFTLTEFQVADSLPAGIPTLSEWGMLVLFLMLGGAMIFEMRRRQHA